MGELKAQVKADMASAMKARDLLKTGVLRMAMAAFQTAEVAGDSARELSDAEEQAVLAKEVASRKDAAEAYISGNRPDLAAKEMSEVEILQSYLPAPLTEEEMVALVDEAFATLTANGETPTMKHMGSLVKAVQSRAQGRAEGGRVAALVKERLAR